MTDSNDHDSVYPQQLWEALNGLKSEFSDYLASRSESDIRSEILALIKNKGGVEKLRDKFAVAALQGLLGGELGGGAPELLATQAYVLADAMLKARH
jgi:hypothetical protein